MGSARTASRIGELERAVKQDEMDAELNLQKANVAQARSKEKAKILSELKVRLVEERAIEAAISAVKESVPSDKLIAWTKVLPELTNSTFGQISKELPEMDIGDYVDFTALSVKTAIAIYIGMLV
jgi:hypothetical protein